MDIFKKLSELFTTEEKEQFAEILLQKVPAIQVSVSNTNFATLSGTDGQTVLEEIDTLINELSTTQSTSSSGASSVKYDSVYTTVNSGSAAWDSTWTTVSASSAKWDTAYGTVSGLTLSPGDGIDINFAPTTYSATSANISGHFVGIDTELNALNTSIDALTGLTMSVSSDAGIGQTNVLTFVGGRLTEYALVTA